jgi:hypothetical protein
MAPLLLVKDLAQHRKDSIMHAENTASTLRKAYEALKRGLPDVRGMGVRRMPVHGPLVVFAFAALLAPALGSMVPAPAAMAAPTSQRDLQPRYYSTSEDWSGYATTGDTYNSVTGAWTQPAVTCSSDQTAYSAFWVGLDGDTSRTVEQIGTESDCSHGAPVYSAWYETYPDPSVPIPNPVQPGDSFSASVTADGGDSFTLTLKDVTQGWTYTTTAISFRAQLGSAEWIAEAPSTGRRALPLADFGAVTFTQSMANDAAISANPNLDAITLAAFDGIVEAQPSSVSADGTSFSVTWQQSGGSGTGTSPPSPFPGHHHHWPGSGGSDFTLWRGPSPVI